MTVDTILYNAKVLAEGGLLEAGVAVDDGKIVDVAKAPNLPAASKRIDLKRGLLLPGLIDPHVHLRGQLQAYEEDFYTGTAAAAVGGITFVLDMPNNQPVTMDAASLSERMKSAGVDAVVNVGFFAAFPEDPEEMDRIVDLGAIGFKLFLTTPIGGLDIDDDGALLHAFSRARRLGVPVAVHAEDRQMIASLAEAEQERGHEGVEAYLKAHTPEVETRAVNRIIRIARNSGAHVHFCHVSSKGATTLIKDAKKAGLPVTCEVTPHHLLLTCGVLKQKGTIMLVDPPVRNQLEVDGLWVAVKSGIVSALASDHAPHLLEEKRAKSIWDVKPGFPGLETLLPLMLTEVNASRLSISELAKLTAEEPARTFHLRNEGYLKEGYNANMTVVDMHKEGRIRAEAFYSKAKYSPFDGWKVKGLPQKTFVNGQLVSEDGVLVVERGAGRVFCGKRVDINSA